MIAKNIRLYWNQHPLAFVLVVALLVRLVAVFLSKGFLMHDDHFLIIESAASWAHGHDTTKWFPWSPNFPGKPDGHSLFYIGLHYIYFSICEAIGFTDPQNQMVVVRLGHALFSLMIIYFSYKITEKLSDWKIARIVGLYLALLAFMPSFSVRNLVEMVTIPPLLWSTWLLIRHRESGRFNLLFYAALLAGVAVGIRYQSVIFVGGLGLVLLIQKQWKAALAFGFFSFAAFFITQAVDLFIWNRPFAELQEYIDYNLTHSGDYITQPWYNYLLVLAGAMMLPISLFILFGFFREWKKHLLLFLPSFLFLLVHSAISNKQERFILPILPFVVILGFIGWIHFMHKSKFWQNHRGLLRGCWIFFWVINTVLLVVLTSAYNKRSRVETMTYLHEQGNLQNFIVEQSHRSRILWPPLFYSDQYTSYFWIDNQKDVTTYLQNITNRNELPAPNYIIFYEDSKLEERVARVKEVFPSLKHKTTIDPGLLDWILHTLNPKNRNPNAYIYYFEELEGKGADPEKFK